LTALGGGPTAPSERSERRSTIEREEIPLAGPQSLLWQPAQAQADQPHVVIVGGGFAGLYAARTLNGAPVKVTLVDCHNYHLFQPLLYQVATAGLSPGDIAQPIRHILAGSPNVTVLLGRAAAVDARNRRVLLEDGELGYDYLVLATGAADSYFGHDEWMPLAPGLKTLDDALEVRSRVLSAFERAEREPDDRRRAALLTFVIIGGGPTGVEMAGALAELARDALACDFRRIDPTLARIVLVERAPRLLSSFPEALGRSTARQLDRLGVEVMTGTAVSRIRPGMVEAGAVRIPADTVLWAAGVTASPLGRSLGVPLDRMGRVPVQPDLSVSGHPEVFVAGDLAAFTRPDGSSLPGMAPVAIQMGRHAADNILRLAAGDRSRPFMFRDRGVMATIGRNAAVAQLGPLKLSGALAWLVWLFVHIMYLIGFRNRLRVLIEWAWAYVTRNRAVRLITGDTAEPPGRAKAEHPPAG
jgi:NADH dehydrogenase